VLEPALASHGLGKVQSPGGPAPPAALDPEVLADEAVPSVLLNSGGRKRGIRMSSREGRNSSSGRSLRILAGTVLLTGLFAASSGLARAELGPYGPAAVNCYESVHWIQTEPTYDKVGPIQGSAPQHLTYQYAFWNIGTKGWSRTQWAPPAYLGPNSAYFPAVNIESRNLAPGYYYVWARYAWYLGSGWSVSPWVRSEEYNTYAGDGYTSTERFCRLIPERVVVG
jgi:hypothetical protein